MGNDSLYSIAMQYADVSFGARNHYSLYKRLQKRMIAALVMQFIDAVSMHQFINKTIININTDTSFIRNSSLIPYVRHIFERGLMNLTRMDTTVEKCHFAKL